MPAPCSCTHLTSPTPSHPLQLSAEEARRAIERQKEDNLALASQIKDESDAMMEQRELEIQMQAMMNRRLVEDINEVRRRPQE